MPHLRLWLTERERNNRRHGLAMRGYFYFFHPRGAILHLRAIEVERASSSIEIAEQGAVYLLHLPAWRQLDEQDIWVLDGWVADQLIEQWSLEFS